MAQNSQDPNMVLDHGRYKGTALKDVPDSYVKWMINFSQGEMEFWQTEQMRRRLSQAGADGTPVIIEMLKAVEAVMKEQPGLGSDTDVRQFVDWARQTAARVAVPADAEQEASR